MILSVLAALLGFGSVLLLVGSRVLSGNTLVERLLRSDISSAIRQSIFSRLRLSLKSRARPGRSQRHALEELPDLLDLFGLCLSAGHSIYSGFARISLRAQGVLAAEFQRILITLELGAELEAELNELSRRIPQPQVVEFANKMVLALQRGTPLVEMLKEQSLSARAELRNETLREVGRNETRMLIPLVFLILPITVLFAIYPSLQLLNVVYQ